MITTHIDVLRASSLIRTIQECDRSIDAAEERVRKLGDSDQFWTVVSEVNNINYQNAYVAFPIAKSLVVEMIKKTRQEAIDTLAAMGVVT